MGFEVDETFVRARVVYFHQIGYYATDTSDSPKQREECWPIYRWVIAGR